MQLFSVAEPKARQVDHEHLRPRLEPRPATVGLEDVLEALAPDHPVARGHHLQLEPRELVERPADGRAERHQDVRVVGLRLEHQLVERHLVVKAARAGEMLTEGVHREEQLRLWHVGGHRLGPVDHAGVEELQRAPPQRQRLAVGDDLEAPGAGVEVHRQRLAALGVAHQLGLRTGLHDRGQTARVIGLGVVADDVGELSGIDPLGHMGEQLGRIRSLDRVDERRLLVEDQVRVVARATACLVAVEVAHVPVDEADPADVVLDGAVHSKPSGTR